MKEELSFGDFKPFLNIEVRDKVVVIRFTDDVIDIALDLDVIGRLWDLLHTLSTSTEVSAILFIGTKLCFSPQRADTFWQEFREQYKSTSGNLSETQKQRIAREQNAMCRFISAIRDCPKPVLMALQGQVTAPFLGISLACDSRIICDDTVFHIRTHKIGLPPVGGLAYFLPLYLGWGKANRFLMETESIEAKQALEIGLVDQVTAVHILEHTAFKHAQTLAQKPSESISAIKKLLNTHFRGMEAYFDSEREAINTALNKLWSHKAT